MCDEAIARPLADPAQIFVAAATETQNSALSSYTHSGTKLGNNLAVIGIEDKKSHYF